MRISIRSNFCRIAPTLLSAACSLVTGAAVVCFAYSAQAADTLAYSFEPDLEGFVANGPGTTVTHDTIGATDGTSSMKVTVISPATFVGATTNILDSNIFGDPPGLDHVTFDLTLPTPFGPEDGTGFAVIGVIVFGLTQPDEFGVQTDVNVQVDYNVEGSELSIGALDAGTYLNQRIELDSMVHPITFETVPFNDIIGTLGSGPDDIIPIGFEFYFNKTGTGPVSSLVHALTLYIDNVRFGTDPAAVAGDYNQNGTVDAADYTLWRDHLGQSFTLTNENPAATTPGVVDAEDYAFWKSQFGLGGGSGGLSSAAVPEPASALLLVVALACLWGRNRGRTAR